MTILEAQTLKEGSRIRYTDDKGSACATVLEIDDLSMFVQFDDRARPDHIFFTSRPWLDHITFA